MKYPLMTNYERTTLEEAARQLTDVIVRWNDVIRPLVGSVASRQSETLRQDRKGEEGHTAIEGKEHMLRVYELQRRESIALMLQSCRGSIEMLVEMDGLLRVENEVLDSGNEKGHFAGL
jgi:hypothetical protein